MSSLSSHSNMNTTHSRMLLWQRTLGLPHSLQMGNLVAEQDTQSVLGHLQGQAAS